MSMVVAWLNFNFKKYTHLKKKKNSFAIKTKSFISIFPIQLILNGGQ